MALREEAGQLFEPAGVPVVYCGVGKVNATYALTRELQKYRYADLPLPLVVNFGTAGSRSLATGTLVGCHEFVQRDMDVRGLGFPLGTTPFEALAPILRFERIFNGLPQGICGSGDSFAMADAKVACDVLDMEAYALAKVCSLEGAGFACAKYITDGADHASADHWRERMHRAAADFLELYAAVSRRD